MSHHDTCKEFTEGVQRLQKKAWDDAISFFSKAMETLGASEPQLFLQRGQAFLGKGWWDEAIRDFRTAISMGHDSADVLDKLAEAYRGKGWWDEAIHFWGAALQRETEAAQLYYRRGLAYFDKGWFNEAIEHWLQAANIDPTDPRYPYAVAVALRLRGQLDDAARFLGQAVEAGSEALRVVFEKYPQRAEVDLDSLKGAPKAAPKAAAKAEPKAAPKTAAKAAPKAAKVEVPAEKKPVAKKAAAKKPAAKKPAVKKPAAAKPAAKKAAAADSGDSMIIAAIKVLEETGKPLHYKDITKAAMARKLIATAGATPEQSMRSAISREITSKGDKARFRRNDKAGKGFYSLTSWGDGK